MLFNIFKMQKLCSNISDTYFETLSEKNLLDLIARPLARPVETGISKLSEIFKVDIVEYLAPVKDKVLALLADYAWIADSVNVGGEIADILYNDQTNIVSIYYIGFVSNSTKNVTSVVKHSLFIFNEQLKLVKTIDLEIPECYDSSSYYYHIYAMANEYVMTFNNIVFKINQDGSLHKLDMVNSKQSYDDQLLIGPYDVICGYSDRVGYSKYQITSTNITNSQSNKLCLGYFGPKDCMSDINIGFYVFADQLFYHFYGLQERRQFGCVNKLSAYNRQIKSMHRPAKVNPEIIRSIDYITKNIYSFEAFGLAIDENFMDYERSRQLLQDKHQIPRNYRDDIFHDVRLYTYGEAKEIFENDQPCNVFIIRINPEDKKLVTYRLTSRKDQRTVMFKCGHYLKSKAVIMNDGRMLIIGSRTLISKRIPSVLILLG